MGNMGSAHPLVEVNVSFKFEENPSISKGVIERAKIGDGPTDRPTRQSESSIAPPHILWWGIKRNNFRVEQCKTEENLSKFLNNMAYKTVTSIRDCVMKRKIM